MKTHELLIPAMRQYRSNSIEEFIIAYDKHETDSAFHQLQQQLADAQRERDEALSVIDKSCKLLVRIDDTSIDADEFFELSNELALTLNNSDRTEHLQELKRREQVKGIRAGITHHAQVLTGSHDDFSEEFNAYTEALARMAEFANKIESGEVAIK